MAQYTEIALGTPFVLSDGTDTFRYHVRSSVLYLDQEITATGFDGVEDTDWGNIESYANSGVAEWRFGVRVPFWYIDSAINATGFAGVENTDWEYIEQHKLPDTVDRTGITVDRTDITVDRI